MKWLSPIINIVAAAMLCGTAWFIFQDFKADFDKREQDRLDAIQAQTTALQTCFSPIIWLANDEIQRRKAPVKIDPFKPDRAADELAKIATELKIANDDELEKIKTDLDTIAFQLRTKP